MKRIPWILLLTICAQVSMAAEVIDFNVSNFTDGIPEGWTVATQYTTSGSINFSSPQTMGGKKALTMNFYSAMSGDKIIYRMEPIQSVECDNISVSIPVFMESNTKSPDALKDRMQVVVSTNNFESESGIFTLPESDCIDLQENGCSADAWITNRVSRYIEGLSDAGHAVWIGIKAMAAGKSGRLGYVGGLNVEFVASATPSNIGFVSDNGGGDYAEILSLEPGEENARISVDVNALPDGAISTTNVYAIVDREGYVTTNMLSCVGGTRYVSDKLTPMLDAGEKFNISIFTEYTTYSLPSLGEVHDGFAYEYNDGALVSEVAKKGSVWVNEALMQDGFLSLEFAGTTNRVMTSGWKLAISNDTAEAELPIAGALDLTTNAINKVVGLDVKNFSSDEVDGVLKNGTNVIWLVNSRGIRECEVMIVRDGDSFAYGKRGIATWNETYGYGYDWTGAADGVFEWCANQIEDATIGSINNGQGFKVPFSTEICVVALTESGARLPNAMVSLTASNILNSVESNAVTTNVLTSAGGVAEISLNGYSCSIDKVPVVISASAFGWAADKVPHEINLSEANETELTLQRSPVFDDCDSLQSYWINTNAYQWTTATIDSRRCLQVNLYSAKVGTNSVLTCVNSLISGGKKYVSVSFDYRNANLNYPSYYNEFCVLLGTNATWSGEVKELLSLSNKRSEYPNNSWYTYHAEVELPSAFSEADLWLRLLCRTGGGSSSALVYLDNLQIEFHDVAMPVDIDGPGPESVPLSGEMASFALDIMPETTGTVADVSADLHLSLNDTDYILPFEFSDGTCTNNISLATNANGEVIASVLSIRAESVRNAIGRPFLSGDRVSYYAKVVYNSDSGATDQSELYGTRYFPDNATINIVDGAKQWVFENEYGVDTDLSAYSFKVEGNNAISPLGPIEPTTDSVSFSVYAYDEDNVASLEVEISGPGDYRSTTNLVFDAGQQRVSGDVAIVTGLSANAEYTVTVNGKDGKGYDMSQKVFTFVTLPTVENASIDVISTTTVQLTAEGVAAGYVVETPGWTRTSFNTWTKIVGTANTSYDETASLYATNKLGDASASSIASSAGYTFAAAATLAPEIETGTTNATVSANADQNDGNPADTEYAIIITNSIDSTSTFVTENGERSTAPNTAIWMTLADWKAYPKAVESPVLALNATNYFSFVSRNEDGVLSYAAVAPSTCWFDMTSEFDGAPAQRTASSAADPSFGIVDYELVFSDPAREEDAMAEVEYSIDDREWKPFCSFPVEFETISFATNLEWDAWAAVGEEQGEFTFNLRARVYSPASGRTSEWAVSDEGSLDFVSPTVTLSSETAAYFREGSVVVTATFSEEVAGFGADAVTVGNGTVSSVVATEVANTYTITVTPTDNGAVTVQVAAGAVKDLAGNDCAASNEISKTYDTSAPTVALSSETVSPFNAKVPFTVTAAFSEAVVGFGAGAVTVVNGTVSSVAATEVANAYTITVAPTVDGSVTVRVAAGAVKDLAGNDCAASNEISKTYDDTAPTVMLSSNTPDPFNANDTFTVTVTFSEKVTGFAADKVTVDNGSVSALTESQDEENTNKVFVVTIVPDNDDVTSISVQVEADKVQDLAGNWNEASETLSSSCVLKRPTVTLSTTTALYFQKGEAFAVAVEFSGIVTDFSASSLTVVNGSAAVKGSGASYTVTITPINDGAISVQIGDNMVHDTAGNGNVASSILVRTYDTTAPTGIVLAGTPANGSTTNSKDFEITVASVVEANAAAGLIYQWSIDDGQYKTGPVTYTGSVEPGEHYVRVKIRDKAQNWSEVSSAWTWTYEKPVTSDIEFDGGVTLPVHPDTGATNSVEFVTIDFKPGDACSFSLKGFEATDTNISNLQMWFVVGETLGGGRAHVKVSTNATYNKTDKELIVTLPATATQGKSSFFIFGIDNKGE